MSHLRVAIYTLTKTTAQEVADLLHDGLFKVLQSQPGFQAYGVAETLEAKLVSFSLWDSGEQAQRANQLAGAWVRDNLTGKVKLQDAQVGDFLFYESA